MKAIFPTIILSLISFVSLAQEEKNPYHLSVNLQQQSIEPYSVKVQDASSPYHYKKREEHELKYGRPILDKQFGKPEVFYTFYNSLINEFLSNYESLLKADLENKRRVKMLHIRRSTILDLEYAEYRSRTIETSHEQLKDIQTTMHNIFAHLLNDYVSQMPKYVEAFRSRRNYDYKNNYSKDKTSLHYSKYLKEYNDFIGHIHPLALQLIEQKKEIERLMKEMPKPNYKKEFLIKEIYAISQYKNNLFLSARTTKHQSDAYIHYLANELKSGNTAIMENPKLKMKDYLDSKKSLKSLETKAQTCSSVALKEMLLLKQTEKFKTDVSLKNNVNKYLKFVQTSGKSTFKKVNSIIQKSKAITAIEVDKIDQTLATYQQREEEYFNNINLAFIDLYKKYTAESQTEAKEAANKELKQRERQEKLDERNKERERKNYWTKRNL
jgi:hypothetical protein